MTTMQTLHSHGRTQPAPLARIRQRRGAIGLLALGIIVLLTATSMAIFVTVNASMASSRKSRDFLRAQQNMNNAVAYAENALTTDVTGTSCAAAPAYCTTSTGNGVGGTTGIPSTFTYKRSWNQPGTAAAGGAIQASGTYNKTSQTTTRAWRVRTVASQIIKNGGYTYGVTAPSAWLATLSSEDDSQVTGTVTGDWHAYGVGKITVPSGSSVGRIISYDDQASVAGNPAAFERSTFAATLDERLLNQRVAACGGKLQRFVTSQRVALGYGPYLDANQLSCYYSITIDEPTYVRGSGVAAVVSYGNIDIASDLINLSGNELHLYTAAGTVKFEGTPNVSAYVYAPNALCSTFGAATVSFTGSLACRQIQLNGTFHPGPVPQAEPAWTVTSTGLPVPTESTTTVPYLEGPGYVDRFGD